jgi:hypothetical protein
MTRLDLQNLVLTNLNDINGTYFLPSQVQVWLNNSQREVQKQLIQSGENWYVIGVTTNTIVGSDTYALPSDFLKMHKLEIVTSGLSTVGTSNEITNVLEPVTLQESAQIQLGPSVPIAYTIKKNCLILRPFPDQIYVLKAQYSYSVSNMVADSDVPDAPTQYHEYLAILTTLDGMYRDNVDPSSFHVKRDFYLNLMKQDSQNRRVDRPRRVVTRHGYSNYQIY